MIEERDPNIVTDTEIRFYTSRFYMFDNFSAHQVELWGKNFPTAEHAYQWKKYAETHPEIADEIFNSKNPHAVKKISDAHKQEVPEKWNKIKEEVMVEIIRAKLYQHEHVKKRLLESGDRTIIENSPEDLYWGIGKDDTGKNILGKIWMRLRDEIKGQ